MRRRTPHRKVLAEATLDSPEEVRLELDAVARADRYAVVRQAEEAAREASSEKREQEN